MERGKAKEMGIEPEVLELLWDKDVVRCNSVKECILHYIHDPRPQRAGLTT
jgi:hypothetical protein